MSVSECVRAASSAGVNKGKILFEPIEKIKTKIRSVNAIRVLFLVCILFSGAILSLPIAFGIVGSLSARSIVWALLGNSLTLTWGIIILVSSLMIFLASIRGLIISTRFMQRLFLKKEILEKCYKISDMKKPGELSLEEKLQIESDFFSSPNIKEAAKKIDWNISLKKACLKPADAAIAISRVHFLWPAQQKVELVYRNCPNAGAYERSRRELGFVFSGFFTRREMRSLRALLHRELANGDLLNLDFCNRVYAECIKAFPALVATEAAYFAWLRGAFSYLGRAEHAMFRDASYRKKFLLELKRFSEDKDHKVLEWFDKFAGLIPACIAIFAPNFLALEERLFRSAGVLVCPTIVDWDWNLYCKKVMEYCDQTVFCNREFGQAASLLEYVELGGDSESFKRKDLVFDYTRSSTNFFYQPRCLWNMAPLCAEDPELALSIDDGLALLTRCGYLGRQSVAEIQKFEKVILGLRESIVSDGEEEESFDGRPERRVPKDKREEPKSKEASIEEGKAPTEKVSVEGAFLEKEAREKFSLEKKPEHESQESLLSGDDDLEKRELEEREPIVKVAFDRDEDAKKKEDRELDIRLESLSDLELTMGVAESFLYSSQLSPVEGKSDAVEDQEKTLEDKKRKERTSPADRLPKMSLGIPGYSEEDPSLKKKSEKKSLPVQGPRREEGRGLLSAKRVSSGLLESSKESRVEAKRDLKSPRLEVPKGSATLSFLRAQGAFVQSTPKGGFWGQSMLEVLETPIHPKSRMPSFLSPSPSDSGSSMRFLERESTSRVRISTQKDLQQHSRKERSRAISIGEKSGAQASGARSASGSETPPKLGAPRSSRREKRLSVSVGEKSGAQASRARKTSLSKTSPTPGSPKSLLAGKVLSVSVGEKSGTQASGARKTSESKTPPKPGSPKSLQREKAPSASIGEKSGTQASGARMSKIPILKTPRSSPEKSLSASQLERGATQSSRARKSSASKIPMPVSSSPGVSEKILSVRLTADAGRAVASPAKRPSPLFSPSPVRRLLYEDRGKRSQSLLSKSLRMESSLECIVEEPETEDRFFEQMEGLEEALKDLNAFIGSKGEETEELEQSGKLSEESD
ncbi:hypothetical protein [Chlamydiifrater phoenicopteri]|uniref:hypothetical protein n=1 Tax=Chlamydiifrater phoenicopteri TaxID=2681469 RepID=UPI001BCF93A0|nr:hypothetical protein [Chlamydiifrater phoenicopteri]